MGEPRPSDLEEVECALCAGRERVPVLWGRDQRRGVPGKFRVVRCAHCGLAYVDPRPTRAAIARYYPDDYAPHAGGPPKALERLYYRLFRRLPVPPPARVLDVGCGGGRYLRVLRERGYRVAGTEPEPETAARVREELGIEVWSEDLADLPAAATFDLIAFWWVLEHTHAPIEALCAAHRRLAPRGHLVVSVQNFAGLGRLLFGRHWHHLDLPGHLYHFEPATLRAALEAAGFEVRRVRQDLIAKDFAPSLGYALGLRQSLDRPLPNLVALPFDLLSWLLRRSGLITAHAVRR